MVDKKPEKATREEEEAGSVPLDVEETREEEEDEGEERRLRRHRRPRRGSNLNIYKPAIIVGIGVLLIAYLMIGAVGVSKGDFTKNIQGMIATIETVKKEVSESNITLDKVVAGLPNTVTTQINSVLAHVTDRLNTVEGNANSAKDIANSAKGSVDGVVGKVDTANTNVATLTVSINDLIAEFNDANAKINTLQTQATADRARINALEDKVAVQETKGSISVELYNFTSFTYVSSETSPYAYANIIIQIDNDSGFDIELEDMTLNIAPDLYNFPTVALITSTSLSYLANSQAVPPLYWFDDFDISNMNRKIKEGKYVRITLVYRAYLSRELTESEVNSYITPMGIDPEVELVDYDLD